jgi:hypothetical protein
MDAANLCILRILQAPTLLVRRSQNRSCLDLRFAVRKNSKRRMPQKSSVRRKSSRKETRELETKISFLEGLIRRDEGFVEALQLLGDHYTQRGQFDDSLRIDERLSRLEPGNPLVFYNLACSYSLTGRQDHAAVALDRALALGYRDFKWLARDPDLRSLRKHPSFRTIEEKIRRMKVKVT